MDANESITDSLAAGSSKSMEPTEHIETAAVETKANNMKSAFK